MPRIQCQSVFNGSPVTLYGFCPHFELGDHNDATLESVQVGCITMKADDLTVDHYDTLCEVLSLNAELQH